MDWTTIFSQILSYFGIYNSIDPSVSPIIHPLTDGPLIAVTNGPTLPLITSYSLNIEENINNAVNQSLLKCGLSSNVTQVFTKIIGGHVVKIADYPWQVSLHRRSVFESTHFCGGSLIHPQWVVTAAHCLEWTLSGNTVRRDAIQRIRVIAGTQTISPSINSLTLAVNNVIIHPKYDTRRGHNDIALISIVTPVRFLSNNNLPINSICLPNNTNEVIAQTLTTTGWGMTRENGYNSMNLRSVDIPLVSSKKCKAMYGKSFVSDLMICAGDENKDSCQGDSGGGLIQRDRTGRATIEGIVSVGNGCGRKEYPGIYTRVSHYIDWIQNITNY